MPAATLNSGDTAWMLMATALVMLMTPAGLALFYGGLSRNKFVLNTVGMSYVAFCTATVAWAILGYTLAFNTQGNPYLGSLENAWLQNIPIDALTNTIPTLLFVAFQGTFAAIAIAIVSGSIAERVKFSTWLIFCFLWVVLVYAPVAHWIWGGGFLSKNGELDFAGGTVIHINAGIAGLVLSLLVGKRKDYGEVDIKPSSIKFTVLGSALLWFGWFGFNAGSANAANAIAANAFLVTNLAASMGGLTWLLVEWRVNKHPTMLGVSSGVVSALVGITPAAGYVDTTGALLIGLTSGLVGYFGVIKLKALLRYDDALDAFGIHGLVGVWGALATGIFANPAINQATGLLYGNPKQVLTQLIAVVITLLFSAVATAVVFKMCAWLTGGARVSEVLETEGLDVAYHHERSFSVTTGSLEKDYLSAGARE